ncbi:hypothetical protein ABE244_19490 [Bacillus toyonensis]|uniref:hypothetical protein n=1 Tax=Bacillus toyonensis TaxID=155322 RepID=UPI003D2191E4
MTEKDMVTLDNLKKEYFSRYAKEHKEQINANARIRRQKQKEKAEKYDELVVKLRSRGIDAEKLLRGVI